MTRPQIILELSTDLLALALHNRIHDIAKALCRHPGTEATVADPGEERLITDLKVSAPFVLRTDDPGYSLQFQELATSKDGEPPLLDPSIFTRKASIFSAAPGMPIKSMDAAIVLLLATLELREFEAANLDVHKSSEAFNLRPIPREVATFAFALSAERVPGKPMSMVLNLSLAGPCSSQPNIDSRGVKAIKDAVEKIAGLTAADIDNLRKNIGTQAITLSLDDALKDNPSARDLLAKTGLAVYNVGLSTEWEGARALRLGLDLDLPDDPSGWEAFMGFGHEPQPPISLKSDSDLPSSQQEMMGVSLTGDALALLARRFARSFVDDFNKNPPILPGLDIPGRDVFGLDRPLGLGPPRGSWDGALTLRLKVFIRTLDELGDVVLKLTPQLICEVLRGDDPKCKDAPEPLLPACGCPDVDPKVAECFQITHFLRLDENFRIEPAPWVVFTGSRILAFLSPILHTFLTPLTGGLTGILGWLNSILLGFFGAFAPTLASYGRQDQVPFDFANERLGDMSIGESVGRIRLARVDPQRNELVLAAKLCPPAPLSSSAKLTISTNGWLVNNGGPCSSPPDPNPYTEVFIQNTGGLPLIVCEVAPRLTDQAKADVLRATAPGELPAVLRPGRTLKVTVQALVHGKTKAEYDPDASPPLLLRILTSAGARILDLNEHQAARPIVRDAASQALRDLLCSLRFPPLPRWRFVPFKDPIPFHPTDRLMERVNVRIAAASGTVLRAASPTGQLLARAFPVSGLASLSVAQARPGCARHAELGLSFSLAGTPERSHQQDLGGPLPELTRILYHQGSTYAPGGEILGAHKLGEALLVLTEQGLHLAQVLPGWLRWVEHVPLRGARALVLSERGPIALHEGGLTLFDGCLRPLWQRPGPFSAAAALGDRIWLTGERGLTALRPGAAEEVSPPLQPAALHEVSGLAVVDGALLASMRGRSVDLSTWPPRDLGRCAAPLTTALGLGAADTGQGLLLFDRYGRPHAAYPTRPWHAALIEWPGMAIEVCPEPGLLVLHDRYETEIDLANLPPEILRPALQRTPSALPALARLPQPKGTGPVRSRVYA